MLEVKTHDILTDKASMHFFELPKLTKELVSGNCWQVWLKLINAKTEEDLAEIEALEVPVMKKAIRAYRRVSTSAEYAEIERLRDKADHDEAQALGNAERRGAIVEREKWQGIVAEKDAMLAEKNVALIEKDTALTEKDALIAELRAKLAKNR